MAQCLQVASGKPVDTFAVRMIMIEPERITARYKHCLFEYLSLCFGKISDLIWWANENLSCAQQI
jgi:hypothetical protein